MSVENESQVSVALKTTALYPLHLKLEAKLVGFAGYLMPLSYPPGIKSEHIHTRTEAGLFDVSHMGQIRISGEGAAADLEKLVTGDISGLSDYQQRYTLLTNSTGGIIDDLMVTRLADSLLLVVNAAGKQRDFEYIKESMGDNYQIEMLADRSLLALQGPKAARVLQHFNKKISNLEFMRAGEFRLNTLDCLIHRCGYSGEDGFEISVENEDALELAELLLAQEEVLFTGLGARDSLRLEAGLCLYGHDIDETTSPVEANLSWAVASKYRKQQVSAGFPGAEVILEQLQSGTERRLVGLRPTGKMPIREGTIIHDENGKTLGVVTSGGFGPTFNGPLAMGYVESGYTDPGCELHVEIRGRLHTMQVAELPFVAHRYYKP